MSTPMEERLRTHYAERTQSEPLPGPDTEQSLDRLMARVERSEIQVRSGSSVRRLPTRPLLLAAAVLVLCSVAGLVVARIEDPDKVSTTPDDDRDEPVTTVPRTTMPTTTSTVPSPDSSVPSVLSPPSSKAVVVSAYGALGWWDGTRWVPANYNQYVDGGVPVAGGEEYQIVSLDGSITTVSGGWHQGCGFDVAGDFVRAIDVGIDFGAARSTSPIAVSGVVNPRPRPVRVLDPSAGPYRAATTAVLTGLGITDAAPNISRVIVADLDGDGTDEELVAADRVSNPSSLMAEAGDYSVVFVRRADGTTTVLAHDVAESVENQTPYVAIFDPAVVADLNGDGRMEVVVESEYYEGGGVSVHEYRADGTAPELIRAGCGA